MRQLEPPSDATSTSRRGRDVFDHGLRGARCRADPLTVTVVAGDNHVRIPCLRERRIEGVIRIPEDAAAGQRRRSLRGRRPASAGRDAAVPPHLRRRRRRAGVSDRHAGNLAQHPDCVVSNPAFVDLGRSDAPNGYRAAAARRRARSRCSSRWFSRSSFSIRFSCAATMRSSAWIAASATPCASTDCTCDRRCPGRSWRGSPAPSAPGGGRRSAPRCTSRSRSAAARPCPGSAACRRARCSSSRCDRSCTAARSPAGRSADPRSA